MTNHGEFNWHELQTRDPQKAMTFYADTVGWTFYPEQTPSGGVYWIAMASGKPVAGILNMEDASDPITDRWMIYIHVDGLDDAIESARNNGAAILCEPRNVPGVGRVAVIREPGGAETGWVTPV
ncbi:MAG: VOC family protein [Leptolyngbyaceae cyanobacterium MO_188.B28]|nr:VOC family protein [Leptolyngbyaceae cyanobacterium MO_188.B28]